MEYVVAILLGAIGSLIAAEFYANAPRLTRWIIEDGLLFLPEQNRERYREEWLAHIEECSGHLLKIWHALGMRWTARRLGIALSRAESKNKQNAASSVSSLVKRFDRIAKSRRFMLTQHVIGTAAVFSLVLLTSYFDRPLGDPYFVCYQIIILLHGAFLVGLAFRHDFLRKTDHTTSGTATPKQRFDL